MEASSSSATKKKKIDPLKKPVLDMSLTQGFRLLNVLVLGDMEAMMPIMYSTANAYFFATDCKRARGRVRPLSRLADYKGMLINKFDIVVSREYDAQYRHFTTDSGLYLTLHPKPQSVKAIYVEETKLSVICGTEQHGYPLDEKYLINHITRRVTELARLKREHVCLPDIDKVVDVKVSSAIIVTHRGITADPFDNGLCAMYNKKISKYNPLYTTYTGLMDAFHKFPSTAFLSIEERVAHLKELGFSVTVDEKARQLADEAAEKYKYLTTPLMPLLPQQALGYIKEGEAKAKASIPRLGIVKGRAYQIRVGWQKRVDTNPTNTVKRGYMTVTVNGHTLFEDRQQDVEDYITGFGLPKIGSMADLYPDILKLWNKKVDSLFPKMSPFQKEDVALLATKPTNYLAHDRGMGKTYMSAAWAKTRGYKRVLVAAQNQFLKKWESELKKFGFKYEWCNDWKAVAHLKERIRTGYKFHETTFFLCSLEFLGLESDIKIDPWTCLEKDDRGYLEAVIKEIKTSKCPSCGKTVGQARKICPNCGSSDYSGRFCNECGTPSYTYCRHKPLTPERCRHIELQAAAGKCSESPGTYPAYRRMKKLFKAAIIDEAQMIKNKLTLRSTASRSIHAKGKMLVTANLMKNWPNELFWPVSWLLGFNNPMFPYKYEGGFPFFAEQFGTELYKGSDEKGKTFWDRIPEVSNLTILWKLMAPFMVRRLKTDIEGAPTPKINVVRLDMDDDHRNLYMDVRKSKLDALSAEMQKENPDSKILGANMWSLRAASTIPVAGRYFPQVDTTYSGTWNKLQWILDMGSKMQAQKKKALIISTLVDMSDYVHDALHRAGISSVRISRATKNRFEAVAKFNNDSTTTLCSSSDLIGRSFDIEKASTVIFTDCGWTPEEHEQTMDRALRIMLSMDPVDVYFLLNKGTIDEHMYSMVFQKGEAIKNVLDRRAVYETAHKLIEAIQVRVAKAILEERHEPRTLTIPRKERTVENIWAEIKAFTPIEQLTLFGGPAIKIKLNRARGKAA